ncbi:MAG TPA: response regulator [Limnobacter sp.]|nr:response regulator [Limnobacter sp.]
MANILLIEDDPIFRDMLGEMLSRGGHQVRTACDGEQGLDMAKSQEPELIITDVLMPKMDGIETVIALEKAGIRAPIIAISGGRRSISPAFNLESATLMGVKATLTKPFTWADLRQAIDKVL